MDAISTKLEQNSENLNQNYDCSHGTIIQLKMVMLAVSMLLKCVAELQQQCMIYAEVSFINKFFNEHIFRMLSFRRLVQFSSICLNSMENLSSANETFIEIVCTCLNHILRTQATFNESNNFFTTEESHDFFNRLLSILYEIVRKNLVGQVFLEKNQLKTILNERTKTDINDTTGADLSYAKAIFLSVFVENSFNTTPKTYENVNQTNSFKEAVLSLVVATLRSESYYFFAVTPREIINSFDWQHDANGNITFQSVPIDCLNEIEIVEKFLKR